MQHQCRITVLDTKVFPEYQQQYLADPKSGPVPFSKKATFFCWNAPRSGTIFIT